MEGFSQNVESVEVGSNWKELREQAPVQAETLIAQISGFEAMSFSEKVNALSELEETLSHDNENRFIAREISLMRARAEEEDRHARRMSELGVVA